MSKLQAVCLSHRNKTYIKGWHLTDAIMMKINIFEIDFVT